MSDWIAFAEQGVELRFQEGCDVVRWDAHEGYRNGLGKIPTTKAVDFVVRTHDEQVVLIEMKDFRGHGIENKRRLSGGDLAKEVAEKVCDTLAGIVWACGREHADAPIHRVVRAKYAQNDKKISVVLWLDRDDPSQAAEATVLQSAIASALRPYLRARVVVTSLRLQRALPATPWPWLEAQSLARAHLL